VHLRPWCGSGAGPLYSHRPFEGIDYFFGGGFGLLLIRFVSCDWQALRTHLKRLNDNMGAIVQQCEAPSLHEQFPFDSS